MGSTDEADTSEIGKADKINKRLDTKKQELAAALAIATDWRKIQAACGFP